MANGWAWAGRRALLAWTSLLAFCLPAWPQQPAVGGELPAPLIAAPLPAADSMASRVLACTACHGPQGLATPGGYFPRIAGKPAGYLYRQLKNFQQGRRNYPAMNRLVELLPEDYLREIAAHFAALELPYAPPSPAQVPSAVLALGERLALQGDVQRQLPACAACHGSRLLGAGDDIPGLLGLSRDYLNSQLGAWRSGQRQAAAPDCMEHVARALTPQEVVAVTAWLSSRPVEPGLHREAASPRLPLRCGAVAGEGGE